MSTVLVTGGAGFIGSELCRQLSEQHDRVLVVDNLVNGKQENLEGLESSGVEFHAVDIRDGEALRPLLEGVHCVFHLACLGVRHSIHSPEENNEVNATASLNLLKLARDAGVARFVYVSSSEVYGTAMSVPMTELHPTFPMTVYGAGKLAGECYTRAYFRTYDFPTTVVRPFNSFGPRCHHEGDSGEVIPKFMLRAMARRPLVIFGDGQQTRDFTYVEDTARGIVLAGKSEEAIGETVNLGQGEEITIHNLAAEVTAVVGGNQPNISYEADRPGDVLRLYADSTRARQALGFEPQVSLREGLERLYAWYQSAGEDPEALLEQEVVRNWEQES